MVYATNFAQITDDFHQPAPAAHPGGLRLELPRSAAPDELRSKPAAPEPMKRLETSTRSRHTSARPRGFTLPEALIATTVFTVAGVGVGGGQLFGLKLYQIGQTRLLATGLRAGSHQQDERRTSELQQRRCGKCDQRVVPGAC